MFREFWPSTSHSLHKMVPLNTKGIRPSLTSLLFLGGDIKLTPGPAQKQERIENMYINQCQARKNRKHLMSVAHLNVRCVASRENFYLLKQTVTTKKFHIFIVSVSWLDRTVCNADILCSIKLYFGTVQLTIVSPTEWLQRLWFSLKKIRWWATGLFCLRRICFPGLI